MQTHAKLVCSIPGFLCKAVTVDLACDRSTSPSAMGIQEDFEAAAARIKPVTGLASDDMLDLYGLYKQATHGDNDTVRPGLLDLKGKAKWDRWEARKGMSKEDAMKAYIELVDQLMAKHAK